MKKKDIFDRVDCIIAKDKKDLCKFYETLTTPKDRLYCAKRIRTKLGRIPDEIVLSETLRKIGGEPNILDELQSRNEQSLKSKQDKK